MTEKQRASTPRSAAKNASAKSTTSKAATSKSTSSKSAPKNAKSAAAKSTAPRRRATAKGTASASSRSGAKSAPAAEVTKPAEGEKPQPAELGVAARAARKRPSRTAIRSQASRRREERPLRLVTDETADQAGPDAVVPTPATAASTLPLGLPDLADLESAVGVLISAARAAGRAAGLQGDDLERGIADLLSYVRHRLTGDYEVDDFGFDAEFTERVWLPLLRPLYRYWFRVEVRGMEHVPDDGSALIVSNHSGTVPVDGLMLQVALHDQHPKHRHVRMLGADLVFQSPVVGELARRAGSTLAANADAERLLSTGHLTAVFPEGFKGVGKGFSERYRLQRFGRGGFVATALRTGTPIIPCSIVGAEEIYPMIGNVSALARVLGFPYFPVTPTFPLLGPLGAVPLPSKWTIQLGEPIETASYGSDAADDPMLVFDLTDQVRETIQQTLHTMLLQRRSVFF